jgi:uncharacterized protein
MQRTFVLITLALSFSSTHLLAEERSSGSSGPGFDCDKATSKIEKRICAEPALAELDLQLSQVYAEAQSETAGIDGESGERIDPLAKEQKIWLKKRNQCKTNLCLKTTYQKRIKYIETHWLGR